MSSLIILGYESLVYRYLNQSTNLCTFVS